MTDGNPADNTELLRPILRNNSAKGRLIRQRTAEITGPGAQTSITLRERTANLAVCATLVLALRPRELRHNSQGKIVAVATFVAVWEVVPVSRQDRAVGQVTEATADR